LKYISLKPIPLPRPSDWLVDRKQLPRDWTEKLKNVKCLLQEGLWELETGGGEVADWVKGKESSALHFYTCTQIMSLLEGAQQGRTKNIFGSYTSALLKLWDNILRSYRKENVYLGEAARLLATHTVYTCPSLQRRITGYEKQVEDCERRLSDYRQAIKEGNARYRAACEAWGLDVEQMGMGREEKSLPPPQTGAEKEVWRSLLTRMAEKELPEALTAVEGELYAESIGKALDYYDRFRRFLHSQDRTEANSAADEQKNDKGGRNTCVVEVEGRLEDRFSTLCQARCHRRACSREQKKQSLGAETGANDQDARSMGGRIPADESSAQEGEKVGVNGSGASGHCSRVAGGHSCTSSAWRTEGDNPKASPVGNPAFRKALTNELLELEAFLQQRRLEVGDADHVLLVSTHCREAVGGLLDNSKEAVEACLSQVQTALDAVQGKRLQQLLLLQSSPAYLDRVAASMEQARRRLVNLEDRRREAEALRKDILLKLAQTVAEREATAAATIALKKKVEASLQELYNGRSIVITGGVTTLLGQAHGTNQ
jgi:hypothetical protein